MNHLLEKLSADDIPTGVMAAAGIILLVLALRAGKFMLKLVILLVSLGLFAGAVWWHLHRH